MCASSTELKPSPTPPHRGTARSWGFAGQVVTFVETLRILKRRHKGQSGCTPTKQWLTPGGSFKRRGDMTLPETAGDPHFPSHDHHRLRICFFLVPTWKYSPTFLAPPPQLFHDRSTSNTTCCTAFFCCTLYRRYHTSKLTLWAHLCIGSIGTGVGNRLRQAVKW